MKSKQNHGRWRGLRFYWHCKFSREIQIGLKWFYSEGDELFRFLFFFLCFLFFFFSDSDPSRLLSRFLFFCFFSFFSFTFSVEDSGWTSPMASATRFCLSSTEPNSFFSLTGSGIRSYALLPGALKQNFPRWPATPHFVQVVLNTASRVIARVPERSGRSFLCCASKLKKRSVYQ